MRIRTFLAIECNPEVQKSIAEQTQPLREQTDFFRWVRQDHLHLTIRFLGSIEESKVRAVEESLKGSLSSFPFFELNFCGIGGFPNLKNPRVLWVGVKEGFENCRELRKLVDQTLVSLGFPKEPEEFIPHVTLARLKVKQPTSLMINQSVLPIPMAARQITFFKSDLTSSGPLYTKLFSIGFVGKR